VSLDCLRPGSCFSNVTSVSGLSSSCFLLVQCYQCLWIVLVLGLVFPMLPVSPRRRQSRDTGSIGKTRPRTKTIQRHWYHWTNKKQDEGNPETLGLSSSWVLFFQCYQCLWIVFVLFLACPMLPVSLDCLRPGSCLSNVTSFSGLSSSWVLFVQCYQCLWIVFVLGLVEKLVTLDKQDPGRRQSRDTGSIGQTRPRTKTIQRHWYHWTNKKQDEGNPETLVTLDSLWIVFVLGLVCPMLPVSLDCLRPGSCLSNVTSVSGLSSSWVLFFQYYQCLWIFFVLFLEETGRRQSRDTGNIGQTRNRTKIIQRNW
jgi:hypothetical protein